MQFRFTFYNDDLIFNGVPASGGIVMAQPDGWKDAKLVLERHKDYSSLIEYFEGDFIWYGSSRKFIQQCEDEQGPDAVIRLVIELSVTYGLWESLFDGRLDVSSMEEMSKGRHRHKMKVPIIRNNAWAKFINRKSIPVDVLSEVDLDGNARAVVDKFTLPLPSQTIRSSLDGKIDNQFLFLRNVDYLSISDTDPLTYSQIEYTSFEPGELFQLNVADVLDLDEVKDRFTIQFVNTDGSPAAAFLKAKYSGTYTVNIRIEASIYSSCAANNGLGTFASRQVNIEDSFIAAEAYFSLYFQKNGETPTQFSAEASPLVLSKVSTYYTYSAVLTLVEGDTLKMYAELLQDLDNLNDDIPEHPFYPPDGTVMPPLGLGTLTVQDNINYLFFWGRNNSSLPIERYNYSVKVDSGINSYYLFGSELLGATFDAGDAPSGEDEPTFITIVADTSYPDTTTDALHLKDVAENIISKLIGVDSAVVSDALDGCKGKYALNKCLHWRGYSMADKPLFMSFDQWWASANPILCLGLAEDGDQIRIEGKEYFYNSIVIVNLPNVPDIIRTWDKEMFVKSVEVGYQKWSAESESGIDDPQSKRTYRTKFTALGRDEKQLSAAVAASLALEQTRRNRVEFSKDWRLDEEFAIVAITDENEPELGIDFESITNLLNSDTRYNVRISAARNFTRWLKWYNGCMQHTTGEKFYFTGGEGNYDMTSQLADDDCEFGPNLLLSEKQDIDVSSDYLVLPRRYSFRYPLNPSDYQEIKANRHNAIGLSRTDSDFTPHHIEKLEYYIVKGYGQFIVNLSFPGEGQYRLLEDGTIRELEDGTKRIID